MRTWVFTFGLGQTLNVAGYPPMSVRNRYVLITASSREAARECMVRLFGRNWAFQYESTAQAGVTAYGLELLMSVVWHEDALLDALRSTERRENESSDSDSAGGDPASG